MFEEQKFHILFYNIQGLLSHVAELTAVIRQSKIMPSILCFNETFLDESIEDVCIEGYTIIARRDRADG